MRDGRSLDVYSADRRTDRAHGPVSPRQSGIRAPGTGHAGGLRRTGTSSRQLQPRRIRQQRPTAGSIGCRRGRGRDRCARCPGPTAGSWLVRWRAPCPGCVALAPDRFPGAAPIGGVAPYPAEGLDWFEGGSGERGGVPGHLADPENSIRSAERDWPKWREVTGPEVAEAFGGLIDDVDRGSLTGDFAELGRPPAVRGFARATGAGSTTTGRSPGTGESTSRRSACLSTSGRAVTTRWCPSATARCNAHPNQPPPPPPRAWPPDPGRGFDWTDSRRARLHAGHLTDGADQPTSRLATPLTGRSQDEEGRTPPPWSCSSTSCSWSPSPRSATSSTLAWPRETSVVRSSQYVFVFGAIWWAGWPSPGSPRPTTPMTSPTG